MTNGGIFSTNSARLKRVQLFHGQLCADRKMSCRSRTKKTSMIGLIVDAHFPHRTDRRKVEDRLVFVSLGYLVDREDETCHKSLSSSLILTSDLYDEKTLMTRSVSISSTFNFDSFVSVEEDRRAKSSLK